jgi:hypothetical protein
VKPRYPFFVHKPAQAAYRDQKTGVEAALQEEVMISF